MATSQSSSGTSTYVYNSANQLTTKSTPNARTFTYDPEGNQLTDTGKILTYNFDNQLKTYTNGTTTTTYTYDATGNRIEKNGATNYQYVNTGNNNVLTAKNLTNGTNTYYAYGLDQISQGDTSSSSRQYYITDGLGNVRYLTNNSGTTLNAYGYDPYGANQTITGSTTNNYAYQDEQKDSESGLIYLRARYYDPTIARFTSEDSLKGSIENPRTQNLYAYVGDNPINHADPSGLSYINVGIGGGAIITLGPVPLPLGFQVGFLIDERGGVFFNASLGLSTPGLGGSVTYSKAEPSPGFGIGASGAYGLAANYSLGGPVELGAGTAGIMVGPSYTTKRLFCIT